MTIDELKAELQARQRRVKKILDESVGMGDSECNHYRYYADRIIYVISVIETIPHLIEASDVLIGIPIAETKGAES